MAVQSFKKEQSATAADVSGAAQTNDTLEGRQKLIDTAVKFLQNPKVVNSPLSHKKTFLQNKGLTVAEIDIAIERAGVPVNAMVPAAGLPPPYSGTYPPIPMHGNPTVPVKYSIWLQFRDIVATVAVICGSGYGLYQLCKKLVIPYLYGLPTEEQRLMLLEKKTTELEDSVSVVLSQLQSRMQDLQTAVQQMDERQEAILSAQGASSPINKSFETQFAGLHNEITSLKGLLINRHQFPAAPVISPVIPSWQLNKSETTANNAVVTNEHQDEEETSNQ